VLVTYLLCGVCVKDDGCVGLWELRRSGGRIGVFK
jgi:hypothetical protein